MSIEIRAADLKSDKTLLIETLQRYLSPSINEERYEWMYQASPHGDARAWIAFDHGSRATVGVAAAFPRRFWVNGEESSAYALGDFCIHPSHRSLGPGVQLQRACLSIVENGLAQICYDFPSERMISIYKRIKIPIWGRILRMAKPFKVDRKVEVRVPFPVIAKPLSSLGNLALSLLDRNSKASGNWAIEPYLCEFGEEFTQLARENSPFSPIQLIRSARYLNWRFRMDPTRSHEVLTAREDGHVLGYSIFTHEGEEGYLEDLYALPLEGLAEALLARTSAILKQRGAASLNIYLLEGHHWVNHFQTLGFARREGCPVIVFAPRLKTPDLLDTSNWFLMQGDRDV